MPKFSVLVPINHNQEDFLPPGVIELEDEAAAPLLKVKAIAEFNPEEALTQEPPAPVEPAAPVEAENVVAMKPAKPKKG